MRPHAPENRHAQGEARNLPGFVIAPDHPALPGHFPGHPVVPGVVLLDHAVMLIAAALAQPLEIFQIATVKFLSPVSPGEQVTIDYKTDASGAVHFTLGASGRAVASGTLTPAAPAPQAGNAGT